MSTGNKSKVCNFLFYLQVPQSAGNLTLGHFLAPWMSAEKLKTITLSLSLSLKFSPLRGRKKVLFSCFAIGTITMNYCCCYSVTVGLVLGLYGPIIGHY